MAVKTETVDTGLYAAMHERSMSVFKESSDCAVKAVAIACGVTYDMAHATCAEKGRKPGGGMRWYAMKSAMRSLGFGVVSLDPEALDLILADIARQHKYVTACLTTRQMDMFPEIFRNHLPGRYIIDTSQHVSAFTEGQLHDWAAASSKRIKGIYEVKPLEFS